MAKYCLKKPSKRVAVGKRHKIEKKVKEHNRKVNKMSKKNTQWKSRKEKTLHVPNACPFKEELLKKGEEEREKIKVAAAARKSEAKKRKVEKRKAAQPATLQKLVQKAEKEQRQFSAKSEEATAAAVSKPGAEDDASVRAYAAEVRRTIETADVIIEVLDARDPLGSRSVTAERAVLDAGKRLVLLINKIDLVPRENVQRWITHLRGELPTIAFKASTQEQQDRLGRFSAANTHAAAGTSKCVGADLLMKLLGNYCRNKDIRTSIRVGVIGFPNVGKSSVINSLKRKRACQTGSQPGITKHVQEIELSKHIRLLDTPGVVLAAKGEMDPVEAAAHAIVRRCPKKTLMLHYTLPDFGSTEAFLAALARRLGRLGKAGRPNMTAAAKHVLQDWTAGRIRYYTEPPEAGSTPAEQAAGLQRSAEETKLLSEMAAEFDIDALFDEQKEMIDGLEDDPSLANVAPLCVPADDEQMGHGGEEEEDDGEEEEEEEQMDTEDGASGKKKARVVVDSTEKSGAKTKRQKALAAADAHPAIALPTSFEITGNAQIGRTIKLATKRMKKKQRKLERRTNNLADALGGTTFTDGDVLMQ